MRLEMRVPLGDTACLRDLPWKWRSFVESLLYHYCCAMAMLQCKNIAFLIRISLTIVNLKIIEQLLSQQRNLKFSCRNPSYIYVSVFASFISTIYHLKEYTLLHFFCSSSNRLQDGVPSSPSWGRQEQWPYPGSCHWFVPVYCVCVGQSSALCSGVDGEKALVG